MRDSTMTIYTHRYPATSDLTKTDTAPTDPNTTDLTTMDLATVMLELATTDTVGRIP